MSPLMFLFFILFLYSTLNDLLCVVMCFINTFDLMHQYSIKVTCTEKKEKVLKQNLAVLHENMNNV